MSLATQHAIEVLDAQEEDAASVRWALAVWVRAENAAREASRSVPPIMRAEQRKRATAKQAAKHRGASKAAKEARRAQWRESKRRAAAKARRA